MNLFYYKNYNASEMFKKSDTVRHPQGVLPLANVGVDIFHGAKDMCKQRSNGVSTAVFSPSKSCKEYITCLHHANYNNEGTF